MIYGIHIDVHRLVFQGVSTIILGPILTKRMFDKL
jgi:hypothetical protein